MGLFIVQKEDATGVTTWYSEVEVHAEPKRIKRIGDVGLVLVGVVRGVFGSFGRLVFFKAGFTLLDSGLFHCYLEELVLMEVDLNL